MNYYELLQVSENASDEVIKMAYKALVKKYHPDTFKGDKAFAEEKTKEINEAYDVLSDPVKRQEYDLFLKQQKESQSKKEEKTTQVTKEETTEINKKKSFKYGKVILLIVAIISVIAIVSNLDMKDTNDNSSFIEYDSYYVGVRTITFEDKETAELVAKLWQQGEATEDSMITLMDEYGESQGGDQLYMVEPGQFVDEIDEWCFDRTRQVGDVAIIENEYGFSICYFSSVKER